MDRSGPPDQRRIGIFGGTFDPIHLGHLRAAEEVREAFGLAQVVFILAASPPHKLDRPIIPIAHRWAMVKEAIAQHPAFTLSDVEIRRNGASYSIDTITHYRSTLGAEEQLFFILGADAFLEIETWKDYHRLFALCDFVVISRPNFDPTEASVLRTEGFKKAARDHYRHTSGYNVYLFSVTPIGISSSAIRKAVKEGRSITYLVPAAVEQYIKRERLYQK